MIILTSNRHIELNDPPDNDPINIQVSEVVTEQVEYFVKNRMTVGRALFLLTGNRDSYLCDWTNIAEVIESIYREMNHLPANRGIKCFWKN